MFACKYLGLYNVTILESATAYPAFVDNYPSSAPAAPNAPRSRELPQEPLDLVDRLVADQASQLLDDENAEHFAQVADELALRRGSVSFVDRLGTALGCHVCLFIDGPDVLTQQTLRGELVEVGDGWCRIHNNARQALVNLDAIRSVEINGGALPEPGPSKPRLASWASVLREFESTGAVVVVHGRLGAPKTGRVVFAGSDHFDLRVSHTDSRSAGPVLVTIPVRSVWFLDRQQ